jgi:lambda family phage portal protein
MNAKRNGLVRRIAARLGYVKRDEAAPLRRSFPAAQINRLTQQWSAVGVSIDGVLSGELPILRQRARDLRKSNEYFQKFLSMVKSNVVGECGMTLKNKATDPHTLQDGELVKGKPDKLANTLIEESFWEWGKKANCTLARNLTWTQAQHLNVEELATCGETLWRMVRGPAAGNRWNFAIEPIAIDRLDHNANHNLSNGNTIRMGVEKNAAGRVVALHITDSDPTDILFNKGGGYTSRRYDAKDFVHTFLMREIGQRGLPWAAASMLAEDAAATRRITVLRHAQDGVSYEQAGAERRRHSMRARTATAAPEQWTRRTRASSSCRRMDIKSGLESPNSIYGDFTGACLRGIACGLSVSYPNLANDYASVNFSSGRMSRQEEMETWKFLQQCVASDFCEPIFAAWLEMALLSGAINYTLPSGREIVMPASKLEKFNQPRFYGRRWQWLDPTKEVAAIAEQLRLKLTTRTRVASELGEEWLEILDELEQEKLEAAARGITLPEDAEQEAALAAAQQDPNEPKPDKEHDDDPENPDNQTEPATT